MYSTQTVDMLARISNINWARLRRRYTMESIQNRYKYKRRQVRMWWRYDSKNFFEKWFGVLLLCGVIVGLAPASAYIMFPTEDPNYIFERQYFDDKRYQNTGVKSTGEDTRTLLSLRARDSSHMQNRNV